MKKSLIVIGIALFTYLFVGFLILPRLIRHYGELVLRDQFSEWATVEQVRFNPLVFRLWVENVNLPDGEGQPWVSVSEVELDVSALSFLKLYPVVDAVRVVQPSVVVRREAKTGQDMAASDVVAVSWQEQVEALVAAEIPEVQVRSLEVVDGRFEFIDLVNARPFSDTLNPINFTLSDFTTADVGENGFEVMAEGLSGVRFSLSGRVDVEARALTGRVDLEGLEMPDLSPYYEPMANFVVDAAVVDIGFNFEVNGRDVSDFVSVSEGHVRLGELSVSKGGRAGVVKVGEFLAEGLTLRYPNNEFGAERVSIAEGRTVALRDDAGVVNLLDLFILPAAEVKEDLGAAVQESIALRWRLNALEVRDYSIFWEDAYEGVGAEAAVHLDELRVGAISEDLSQAVDLEVSARLADLGTLMVKGALAPDISKGALELELKRVQLGMVREYAKVYAGLDVVEGSTDVTGRLFINETGAFCFEGDLNSEKVVANYLGDLELGFGYDAFSIHGVFVESEPLSVEVDMVELNAPYVDMARLAEFGDAGQAVEVKEVGAIEDDLEPDARPLDLVIGQVLLTDGSLEFIDQSVQPQVEVKIRDLQGVVEPFDLEPTSVSTVKVEGAINHAKVLLEGDLSPFAWMEETGLDLSINGLGLPVFSPYSGQTIGRSIANGMFSMESSIDIQGGELDAKNAIVLEQFSLGERVESEDAIRLPYDLALSLLKRPDGTIQMKLPVSGDLSDPKVGAGQLIVSAFVNLITKTAAAPFSLLGGLVGSETDISSARFEPNSSHLSAETMDRLNLLAKALQERPNLRLKLIPAFGEVDRLELARELMEASSAMEVAGRVTDATKTQGVAEPAEATVAETKQEDVLELVTPEMLQALGQARLDEVKQYLINVKGFSADRIAFSEAGEPQAQGSVLFELF